MAERARADLMETEKTSLTRDVVMRTRTLHAFIGSLMADDEYDPSPLSLLPEVVKDEGRAISNKNLSRILRRRRNETEVLPPPLRCAHFAVCFRNV